MRGSLRVFREVKSEPITLTVNGERVEAFEGLQEVKSGSRVGMGYCQARMCTPAVTALLQRHAGVGSDLIGAPSARPPVRPCTIGQLCDPPEDDEAPREPAVATP